MQVSALSRCVVTAPVPSLFPAMPPGQACLVQAEGGEWKQELLFVVPRDHEEIERLENRYKK